MKNVYVLELHFSGDTYVFETAEMARDFAIQEIKKYYEDIDEDYETLIDEINSHYNKYGVFDTEDALCFKVPFITKED